MDWQSLSVFFFILGLVNFIIRPDKRQNKRQRRRGANLSSVTKGFALKIHKKVLLHVNDMSLNLLFLSLFSKTARDIIDYTDAHKRKEWKKLKKG